MKVIPIPSRTSMTKQEQEIVDLAFENWLERLGVLDGSPEDDFYRAEREVMGTNRRKAVLFLVNKSSS